MPAFVKTHAFELGLIAVFALTHAWDSHRNIRKLVQKSPAALYCGAILLMWILAITISHGSSAKFIYFDF
jgi:hypothetical protein